MQESATAWKCKKTEKQEAATTKIEPDQHNGVLLVDSADRRRDSMTSAVLAGQPGGGTRERGEHNARGIKKQKCVTSKPKQQTAQTATGAQC